ncbi:MAG: hypothetical protein E6Q42_07935 [Dechloromonas sp.]|nr:MAG: hypothetical protein E6Q42_07935 [Dechloromonas sp.]
MPLLRTFLLLLLALPTFAQADMPLQWRCWYDREVKIICLIDDIPSAASQPATGTLPANLPAVVRQMRNDPAAFRNRFVEIPLFTPPFDMAFTAQLAKASVCGSRRDCSVNFTAIPANPTEIVALLQKNQLDFLPGQTQLLAMNNAPQ